MTTKTKEGMRLAVAAACAAFNPDFAEYEKAREALRAHLQSMEDASTVQPGEKPDMLTIECEEFYNLMQAYRHAPAVDQAATIRAYEAVKDFIHAFATPPQSARTEDQEREAARCSVHPDAPHGFDRNASHNAGRYVCECEGWAPEPPEGWLEAVESALRWKTHGNRNDAAQASCVKLACAILAMESARSTLPAAPGGPKP